jgi:hypothetical protein
MLTVSTNTANAINKSSMLSMTNGCVLEYNMNDLISGTSITAPDGVITATLTAPASQGGYTYKPFEKLFPITSIIDPRRPKLAGVQYMILGDPSVSSTLNSGIGSTSNYGSSKEFAKRLYFSSTKTAYKYWVTPKASGTSLSNCILTVTYPANKTAAANKITIKFETSHSKPTGWTLKLLNLVSAESTIYTGTTCPEDGVVNLYYNGSSWTTLEPSTLAAGVDLSGLKLQINSIDISGGYLGVIEISAKYMMDVSQQLEYININQNSSDSVNGIVPVGDVTANALTVDLNAYDKSYEHYDKTNAFNKNKLNLYKNITIKPYTVIEAEKINLGTYYLDSYTVDEFGSISVTALDGARELQYIKPPDTVTKDMSSVAIIRRMLDSVGFTNYKFNLATDDTSTITPFYWYTDPNKTVWQHIQDLCKDTQMIAVFDQSDVLQFYPRDYIFAKNKAVQASFRYDATSDGKLPNISSISIENVPSVKAVKVLYSPQLSSAYLVNADPLYTSPVVTLGAAALTKTLLATAPVEGSVGSDDYAPLGVVYLEPVIIDGAAKQLYSYGGYLVIEKEIVEYDAIQYTYQEVASPYSVKYKWMTSESDVQKYQGLAKPNTFAPTGKYRIKGRNVFNVIESTDAASLIHNVNTDSLASEWSGYKWDSASATPAFTPNSSVFTLKEVPVSKDNNLLNAIPRSMMTLFAPNYTSTTNPDPTLPPIPVPNTNYSIATSTAKFLSGENFVLGTNMYFPLMVNANTKEATGDQKTIAGLAFSLSADNKSGYLLTIGTSQNASVDKNYRDVNFYKIVNGKPVSMTNSQKDTDGTIITNINGGQLYRVDIRANYSIPTGGTTKVLALKVLINNKTFAVIDTTPLTLTEKVGLLSLQGTSAFDYVYASSTTKEEFLSNDNYNLYKGFLGGESSVIKNFGDFAFAKGNKVSSPSWLKEFGPVARELRRVQTRYSTPGFPRFPQLVNNPDVTIVGSSFDSFTMDTFVMNNSGAFTELANGQEKQFIVVGDFIVPSDQFEYIDPALTDIDKQEQVGFESTWIQKESEAKALAKWISDQWSKQQKVLTLETFINPTLQIGDVIEVSYTLNKIYSSEDASIPSGYAASKFVILSIDSTYDKDSPPTTSITCRSIYTG